jgi:hypothetical protein
MPLQALRVARVSPDIRGLKTVLFFDREAEIKALWV